MSDKHKSDPVQFAVENDLCSGCGLCVSMTGRKDSKMQYNNHLFLRPKLSAIESFEEIRLIKETCPGIIVKHLTRCTNYHPLWGPIVAVRAGYSNDKAIRYAGSSGGVLTAILVHILQKKFVDAIVQVGADERKPYGNRTVVSTTPDEIVKCAGSRYAPSSPLENIRSVCKEFHAVAVVAKPCDIAAIRRLLENGDDAMKKIRLLLSFFCAGVPSLEGAKRILDTMRVDESNLKVFRYRGNGWPGRTSAILMDGNEFSMTYEESWGEILNKYLQLRCKICPDGTGEFADISCADAWHIVNGRPEFSERPGRSLIMTRTVQGELLIDEMIKSGAISAESYDMGMVAVIQPYQAKRKRTVLARITAMKLLGLGTPRYKNLKLFENMIAGGVTANFKSFAGMLFRGLKIRTRQRRKYARRRI